MSCTSASGSKPFPNVHHAIFELTEELQWHVSKYVNSNGTSPNFKNYNGINQKTFFSQSQMPML
jgi:hypothetical protein